MSIRLAGCTLEYVCVFYESQPLDYFIWCSRLVQRVTVWSVFTLAFTQLLALYFVLGFVFSLVSAVFVSVLLDLQLDL